MKQFQNGVLVFAICLALGCQTLNLLTSRFPGSTPTPTARPKATATVPSAQPVALPSELPAEQPTEPPTPVTATINTDSLRVRAAPNANAAILDRLNKGDTVQVLGRTAANDWLQISPTQKPSTRGWISAQFAQVSGALDTVPVVSAGQPNVVPPVPPGQPPAPPPAQPYPAPQPPRPYP